MTALPAAAPDLGAYEAGRPTPVYGPRSAPSARLQLSVPSVSAGSQATLSWTTTDASSVTIDALGAVPASGYAVVTPAQTTTYVLTAINGSALVTATATLVVDGTTPAPTVPPVAPGGVTAVATASTAIHLTWSDGSDNENGFTIEQSLDGITFGTAGTVAANATTFDVTGLNASTTYTYRVRAFNAAGVSAYSQPASATTLPAALGAPTMLTASALSKSQVRLAWRDNSSAETGFRIERSTNASKFALLTTVAAGVVTFTDGGLRAGETYYYRVIAVNASGKSAASNVASATTPRK